MSQTLFLSFGNANVRTFFELTNFFINFFENFVPLSRSKSKTRFSTLKQFLMDIDLLSKMVKELILDNDRVALPGLGSFVAEIVPSTFSDKGFTINPPYRRLYFRSRPDQGDELTRLYARANSIEIEIADRIIKDFVAELKTILFSKKTVIFPGLGRLRATKENAVFFVADEDLDIYPAGFGLEPISLKTHQESAEEVTAAVEGLKNILEEQLPEPQPESQPGPQQESQAEPQYEVQPEPVQEPIAEEAVVVEDTPEAGEPELVEDIEPTYDPESVQDLEPKVHKPFVKFLVAFLVVVLVIGVLLGAYLAVAHFAPHWLDNVLYTKEELEILNYQF